MPARIQGRSRATSVNTAHGVRYTELSPTRLRDSGQTDWWLLLFLPNGLSRIAYSSSSHHVLCVAEAAEDAGSPPLSQRYIRMTRLARLKRMTLGKFFVAGLVALFGGTIKPAHAQFPFPIPPPPPPIFNPSAPYTIPPRGRLRSPPDCPVRCRIARSAAPLIWVRAFPNSCPRSGRICA
jgi:hypothetical protein